MIDHRPASRFVLRAPILPFDRLARCNDIATLRRTLDDPTIREAIFLASPGLYEHLEIWLASGETTVALEHAMFRYLSRMASRATPFGLFAGVAVGAIAGATALELAAHHRHRRHTRLDSDLLVRVCDELADEPALRRELRYVPNTSGYRAGPSWRYAEAQRTAAGRSYHLAATELTDELAAALARAADGATIDELVDALAVDPELARDDIAAYIDALIAGQVVVPALQPPVTGDEPTGVLAHQLAAAPAGRRHAATLDRARCELAALDATPLGAPVDRYASIARGLAALPVPLERSRLFQVDLQLGAAELALGPRVIADIDRGIALLCRIGRHDTDDDALARFRAAFRARYGTREVAMNEVLDEESGIGFGAGIGPEAAAPLLADLAFAGSEPPARVAWDRWTSHLLALYSDAIARQAREIELRDADIDALAVERPIALGDSFVVDCQIAAASARAVDEGRFTLRLDSVGGRSATRLLGRFCHGSAAVHGLVRELVEAERRAAPDAVLAEVVHLPEGRVGNILLRPVLRDHEICYLGAGGGDPAHRLALSDLAVAVIGDRIVLRSARLGKEVRPQLAAAHNTSTGSLPVYRFLCALAAQHGRVASWWWGPLDAAPFLPRVRHGRLVLARARWRLGRADLAPLTAKAAHAAVQALRAARRLPRWIAVAERDREFAVDLDNPLSTAMFAHFVRTESSALVYELLPDPDALCLRGPGGGFVHQLHVPYVRCRPVATRAGDPAPAVAPGGPAVARRFPPGSSWLCAKLYAGPTRLELVLRDVVHGFVGEVLAAGLASHAFFARDADPAPHLRLCFAGEPGRLIGELLPAWSARCRNAIDAEVAWRFQLDTYEREVERYGGAAGIELAERMFAADSLAALAILERYPGDGGAALKWRLALRGIDQLLGDLGLAIRQRFAVVSAARARFGAALGMTTALHKQLGHKFRRHRAEIAALLEAPCNAAGGELAPGLAALAERSRRNAPIAEELRALCASGAVSRPLHELAEEHIGLHVNRMLAAAHDRQAVVLCDLLRRHYDGIVARGGNP